MFAIIGLIVLVAAVIIGVAGIFGNAGSAHELTPPGFTVFGYHVTGSTGTLFLSGMVVGAAAMIGLSLLLTSYGRTARRGRAARQGLDVSRRRTAAIGEDRDALIAQRAGEADGDRAQSDTRREDSKQDHRRWHLFGHRPAHR